MSYILNANVLTKLLRVLFLNQLSNGVQLHIAGAFVDGSDLSVAEELLLREVAREANSSHEVYALGCEGLGDF